MTKRFKGTESSIVPVLGTAGPSGIDIDWREGLERLRSNETLNLVTSVLEVIVSHVGEAQLSRKGFCVPISWLGSISWDQVSSTTICGITGASIGGTKLVNDVLAELNVSNSKGTRSAYKRSSGSKVC